MKHHTLSKYLFAYYFVFLLFLLLGVWATITWSNQEMNQVLTWINDPNIMNAYDEYEEHGATTYLKYLKDELHIDTEFFLLLDANGVVMDFWGIETLNGEHFDEKSVNALINDPDSYAFYPYENSDELAIVRLAGGHMKKQIDMILLKSWGLFSLAMVLGLYSITLLAAGRITKPIETLTDSIQENSNGQFSFEQAIKPSYEVNKLQNALLTMSNTIRQEMSMRIRSEEERKKLILNISHDLKNPLTNIRGYAESALIKAEDQTPDLAQHLQIIINNSIKADNLLLNLFQLSTIENACFQPNLKQLDLCETVRLHFSQYIPELEALAIDYEINVPEETLSIYGDEELLLRAFSNLIDNSIRYLVKVTDPKLSINAKANGSSVFISFIDNGPGIAPEVLPRIFNPFVTDTEQQTKESETSSNTGLGLAITRAIVEKHRGNIQAENSIPKGAQFTITLPLLDKESIDM